MDGERPLPSRRRRQRSVEADGAMQGRGSRRVAKAVTKSRCAWCRTGLAEWSDTGDETVQTGRVWGRPRDLMEYVCDQPARSGGTEHSLSHRRCGVRQSQTGAGGGWEASALRWSSDKSESPSPTSFRPLSRDGVEMERRRQAFQCPLIERCQLTTLGINKDTSTLEGC